MSDQSRPKVTVLLSERARGMVLRAAAAERLNAAAEVTWAPADPAEWDLDALIGESQSAITGWYTPEIPVEVIERHPSLQLIAHAAGSVRGIVPLELIGPRLRVTQATQFFAPSVSEFTIMQILSGLRHLPALDREMKAGTAWEDFDGRYLPGLIASRTAGVVGASRMGRAVIALLRAFGAHVLVVDPTVPREELEALGAEPTDLDDLLKRSDIVTLHVPLLPETEGMIGAREFALIKDGALFVNSARGGLIDNDALYEELVSGRISAALDVFEEEPLPVGDRWRSLDNVIISPHRAGFTREAHLQNGDAMVDEVLRFAAGEPLSFEMPPERVSVIA